MMNGMLNNQLQFTEFDFIFNCWCFMILNENKAMLNAENYFGKIKNMKK